MGCALIPVDQEAEEQSLRAWRPCYIPVLRALTLTARFYFAGASTAELLKPQEGEAQRKTLSSVPSKDAPES